jgi:cellulose synthase/poly-beta-1,6-N-acetylglucosamine synthase-like glycosyltransferase
LKDSLVSIIIPCKEIDDLARECVEHCRNLDYPNFEILVLPDVEGEELDGVRVLATGALSPGAKRNIGVMNSFGDFCAFIDSDAYPRRDWLKNAVKYLNDPDVGAVGGPGLTPENASFMEKASGYVLSSFMVGRLSSRYDSKGCFESDDIHSCNFVAKKAVLKKAGGWNEKYWPGEDTLMCLAIKDLGKKMVDASDVVVFHHRRSLFRPHLKQVSRFGEHRGFFAKKFPENSLRLNYFFPLLLVLFFFGGSLASFLSSLFLQILMVTLVAYLGLSLLAAALQGRQIKLMFLVWLGIIATHTVYGLFFLSGLIKRDLKR